MQQKLTVWGESLFPAIPIADLLVRNPVAHKWKAPFRSMMLREAVFWRLQDLLIQSYALHQQGHGLGARILLRSAFETLATLIYLNILMGKVLDGTLDFHDFSEKTAALLIGSKNDERGVQSINIMTVLKHCDTRYPGLLTLYGDLSESAHPSNEGLCSGYSTIDHDEYQTNFSNRWMELYGDKHVGSMELCMTIFLLEYNNVWGSLFEQLEKWIEDNDKILKLR